MISFIKKNLSLIMTVYIYLFIMLIASIISVLYLENAFSSIWNFCILITVSIIFNISVMYIFKGEEE